jgi:glycosyltransferase involved in cell wall biosynthesis
MNNLLFISNNNLSSEGLSGGDRIFVELIKGWKNKINIGVLGTGECFSLLSRYEASKNIKLFLSAPEKKTFKEITNSLYLKHTINRTFWGIFSVFKYHSELKSFNYIYSASDFYPDTIPALILKLLSPRTVWIAGFYLFAPKPWQKDNPYRTSISRLFTNIYYWLTQKISFFLVYRFADYVYVTSKPDQKKFISSKRGPDQIIIVQGGVDIMPSKNYQPKIKNKKYLAVFLGRFHHQKGVLELIDIWKNVTSKLPDAKLVMVGNGQLLEDIKNKIQKLNLQNNIDLFGFLDGPEKYKIFKNSSIVVHPATYDSGGMAAAEAMAWGLPGVSFDLEALKTYYPKGMIKTKCFDLRLFADNIVKLKNDKILFRQTSHDAKNLVETVWSWPIRCLQIYEKSFF